MPDYPQEAADAAAEAILTAQNASDGEPERHEAGLLARAVLDAAAPILTAAATGAPVIRAGRSNGRTLYEVTGDDWKAHQCIGMVDSQEWADRIVAAVNAAATTEEIN